MRVQPKAKASAQTRHQQDQEVQVLSSSGESDDKQTSTAVKQEPLHAVFWDRLSAGPFATAGSSGQGFNYNTNLGCFNC